MTEEIVIGGDTEFVLGTNPANLKEKIARMADEGWALEPGIASWFGVDTSKGSDMVERWHLVVRMSRYTCEGM